MFSYKTRFLIVDDFVTIRKVMGKTLKDLGYTNVLEAEDGRQALALLQAPLPENKIQFVIADMHMPHLEGPDLWALLQKNPDFQALPFLFLTTGDDLPVTLEGLKSEYSDYIVKPCTPQKLKNKLESMWQALNKSKNLKVS